MSLLVWLFVVGVVGLAGYLQQQIRKRGSEGTKVSAQWVKNHIANKSGDEL